MTCPECGEWHPGDTRICSVCRDLAIARDADPNAETAIIEAEDDDGD